MPKTTKHSESKITPTATKHKIMPGSRNNITPHNDLTMTKCDDISEGPRCGLKESKTSKHMKVVQEVDVVSKVDKSEMNDSVLADTKMLVKELEVSLIP